MASLADSFIGDEQLEDFDPRGRAGMEVLGPTADGAIDMDFTWDEGDVDDVLGKAQVSLLHTLLSLNSSFPCSVAVIGSGTAYLKCLINWELRSEVEWLKQPYDAKQRVRPRLG